MTSLMTCPVCANSMLPGWLAMWNPVLGQKVRWQPTRPGWVRMRVPERSVVVLEARFGGKDAREAQQCGRCSTTVIVGDLHYDK